MRRTRILQVTAAVFVIAGAWLGLTRGLSAQLGPGTLYLATVPPSSEQSTLRVNTGTTPNRTEIGCESFRLVTTTVNCIRITGGATGSPSVIAPIAGQGGDTTPKLSLGAGMSGFSALNFGSCQVSAPSGLSAFGQAIGQAPCTAPAGITGTSLVWVQTKSTSQSFSAPSGTGLGLENGLLLKAATPTVAGNQIILSFQCASSSACPTTSAQTYFWWAINP